MSSSPEETTLAASADRLRLAPLWWFAGWVLVAMVIYGSLSAPFPTTEIRVSDKIVHFSAYCAMALWFSGLLERRRYPWIAGLLIALGGIIEILQGEMGFGRDADWRDFLANTLGVGLAVGLAYAGLGSWLRFIERRLGLS